MTGRNVFMKLAVAALVVAAAPSICAAMSVSLLPSAPSPAPLGSRVVWTATVADSGEGTLWYRFRARGMGGDFRVIRDYSPIDTLVWTAIDHEGIYEVEASVRNLSSGDIATAAAIYEMTPRATGSEPVITPTPHPLVFLYSAPACPAGQNMSVQFQSPMGLSVGTRPGPCRDAPRRTCGDGKSAYLSSVTTPPKACADGKTMNFYLAGLRPGTQYSVRHTVEGATADHPGGTPQTGPELTLTVPEFSLDPPPFEVLQPPLTSEVGGIILHAPLNATPTATDMYGHVLWFYPGYLTYLTRPEPGGFFFGIVDNHDADQSGQIVRKFDLEGNTVAETNAARVNEQLSAMGKRPITAFHHEASALADGKMVVLGAVEQILKDVQGPGDVDVLGDAIVVLDADLQVVWSWDAFDHLDPHRMAIFNQRCVPPSAGCSPFYLSTEANDWTHGNSVQPTPDGNLLYSIRHQDWVVKIDYSNGTGGGNIIWRLGKDGDFVYDSTDPYPWFAHQHDARFLDESTIGVFDNGNTRSAFDAATHSRGQVIHLDEQKRIASLLVNADLGGYSAALGSAGKLPNGNYYFGVGFLEGASSLSVEVDPNGNLVYSLKHYEPEYRSFRMQDLYTPY